jgi:hypothetical protein
VSYDFGVDVLGAGPVIGRGGGHGGRPGPGPGPGPGPRPGGLPWRGGGFWPGYGYPVGVPYYGPDTDHYFDAPVYELVDEDDSAEEDDLIRRLALKMLLEEAKQKDGKKPEDVVGAFDIQSQTRDFKNLKIVPVSAAQTMLAAGQDAINAAISNAKNKERMFSGPLPRGSARENVMWKLRWHADNIAKLGLGQNDLYPNADDLKKWVLEAFMEANAVDGEPDQWTSVWANKFSAMMVKIGQQIAAIPAAALAIAKEGLAKAETTARWTLGITLGVVGLVGYAAYKIATGPLGQTAVHAAVSSYTGGGFRR